MWDREKVLPFEIFIKLLEMLPKQTDEKGAAAGDDATDPAAAIDQRAKEIIKRDNVDYAEATRRVIMHEKHLYDSYL